MMRFSKLWVLLFCSILIITSCTNKATDDSDSSTAESSADAEIDDAASDTEVESDSSDTSDNQAKNDEFENEEFSEDELDEEVEPVQEQAQKAQQEPVEPVEPQNQAQQEPPMEDTTPPPAAIVEPAPMAEPAAPTTGSASILDIRYLANQNGGTVVIETSEPVSYQTRMNADTNQYIVEISGAELPAKLKRPYLMKDFGGSFAAINAYQAAGSPTARVVIQLKSAGGEPVVQQEGSQLVVIPSGKANVAQAETPEEGAAEGETAATSTGNGGGVLESRSLDEFLMGNNKFYGKEISIQVKDGDIRDVLNFIAEESGINMVLSEDVKGTVSLKMRKVPWDQALVTVMRAKKLGYVRQGNVIRISGLDSLQQETEASRRIIESQKQMAPLRVKVLPVSYGKVEELVTRVQTFLSPNRGAVIADPRTSTLIVTDTDEVLTKITRLIKELDIAPAQVMIEGKIVEASETFSQTLGVNWGLSGSPVTLSSSGGYNGSAVNLRPSLGVAPIDQNILDASMFRLGLTLGKLDVLGNLSATLAMAERDSLVKIISSPRVVTINKEKAQITQKGEQITVGSVRDLNSVTTTVTRTPVIMDLSVTPQITSDGGVIMEVEVKREFAGALEDTATRARAINSRSAKTKILVKNGQTTVIGGIYQNDATNAEAGVPYLKDIPVVGWLFKSKSVDTQKNELLIFLTPRILNIEDQQAKEETAIGGEA